ncbi:caspase family protein [Stieleria varia]|uniref:Caspase domain protein n=1 Tax=Stieleria varia TaxID=2528005 RepID=A0A5C6B8G8_9BACT|nr:caspase family protein [Stieleria varia]TWU07546.1 Caspase domain protein [Stieleria varia]
MSVPIVALIVGIDHWLKEDLHKLKGAVNDARLMQRVLQDRFGATDENVRMLLNEEATREGITKAFQEHLIDRAKSWRDANSGEPSPAFVFFYAGHGSRATDPTGTQPDGKDETIVPYDSRVGEVFDVKDWEIGGWLDQLTQYTDNVTVIMDCCNSGSGTRDIDEPGTARVCEADERPQPTGRPISDQPKTESVSVDVDNDNEIDDEHATTRGSSDDQPATGSGSGSIDRYVAFAACRSYEAAKEYTVKKEESKFEDKRRYKQGAFTWLLAKEMMKLPPDEKITYQELFERVRYQVHRMYRSQMPQCEGDRNRLLFGGVRVTRDPMVTVIESGKNGIWIDVGAAHGYSVGAKFNVYPENTRTVDANTLPIATMTVAATQAVRSLCTSDDDRQIPELSRAVIIGSPSSLSPSNVFIEADDEFVQSEITDRLAQQDIAGYITITDDKDNSDFRIGVSKDGDNVTLRDRAGKLLVTPTSVDELDLLAADLSGLCRYHNVLQLENRSTETHLQGKVTVEIHAIDDDPTAIVPNATMGAEDDKNNGRRVLGIKPIEKTVDGIPIVPIDAPIAIGITNHSDEPLYCEVISFGYDYAIVPLISLTSGGSLKRVMPGGTIWLGRDENGLKLKFRWPKDPDAKKYFVEGREFLKVIATKDEPNYLMLQQNGLRVPYQKEEGTRASGGSDLDQLFNQAMAGSRALGLEAEKTIKHDWTTSDLEYLIVRPDDQRSQSIPAGKSTDLDQFDITVTTPKSLSCEIKVLTEQETTRSTQAESISRPTAMVWNTDTLMPVTVTTRSSTAPEGVAIEINADASDLDSLSPDSPLTLELNGEEDTEGTLMAVAWDGQTAIPVAVSKDNRLEISWLPHTAVPAAGSADQDESQETTRSLLRTIKLYLFRSVKIPSPELGLHHVRFVPTERVATEPLRTQERTESISSGEVRYRPVTAQQPQSGQRVAVLVHGFASDSKTILTELSILIGPQLSRYDHVLAFDYESYNTPISENGKTLAEQLTEAGMNADDGIELDVFATSMGALVARSMVEQHGGGAFVDRCFLAGPPSAGSPAIRAKMAVPLLAATIVNLACPAIVNSFLNAGIRKIERDAVGLNDMSPGSDFLKALHKAGKPDSTRYCILAGNFDPSRMANPWTRLLATTADVALNLFFADNHDLMASTSSITTVNGKNIEIATVPCHHFQYFQTPECGSKLESWLGM